MKKSIILFAWLWCLPLMWLNAQDRAKEDYLRKVLANLEKIESAEYNIKVISYQPGDTVPSFIHYGLVYEYDNPKDTAIGACFVSFGIGDTVSLKSGYDGAVRLLVYNEDKLVKVDDFTSRVLPFRPITPPFLNRVKSIIRYALDTKDRITATLMDEGEQYHFKLVIEEEKQVEFFGKAYYIPVYPSWEDPTSVYELWIRKTDDLPYKIKREMHHDKSICICSDAHFNQLSISDFDLFGYIPQDYRIEKYQYGKKKKVKASDLIGKPAPAWTLNNAKSEKVSLSDVKSKVVLLNFTGVGCGACQAAVPFLKELKSKYADADFELIAIESWSRTPHSIQVYSDRKQLNYPIVGATDQVLSDYQTGGAAPYLILLDEHRIIRNVFYGYSQSQDLEITKAIEQLLNP